MRGDGDLSMNGTVQGLRRSWNWIWFAGGANWNYFWIEGGMWEKEVNAQPQAGASSHPLRRADCTLTSDLCPQWHRCLGGTHGFKDALYHQSESGYKKKQNQKTQLLPSFRTSAAPQQTGVFWELGLVLKLMAPGLQSAWEAMIS